MLSHHHRPPTCHSDYPPVFFLPSESLVRLWAPGCRSYGGFGSELDLCWAAASVCSHHAHRTKVRRVCVCVLKSSSACLMCSELGQSCRFAARRYYVCVRFCSHTTLTCLPSTRQTCRDIGNKLVFSKSVDACWGRPEYVSSLEHVQARLTLSHSQRGKLAIHLISPLGTRSTLLFPRYKVKYATAAALFRTPHPKCAFVCAALFYLCEHTPSSMLSVLNKINK